MRFGCLPSMSKSGATFHLKKTFASSIIYIKTELQEGNSRVRKLAALFLIIGIWAGFSPGCAWSWSKETLVRCPKCSTTFTIDEDIRMRQITQ